MSGTRGSPPAPLPNRRAGRRSHRVLAEVARALKPGGRFALELQHRDWIVGALQPAVVLERDGDLLIDRNRFEPLTGRIVSERTLVRGGRVRRVRFFVRRLHGDLSTLLIRTSAGSAVPPARRPPPQAHQARLLGPEPAWARVPGLPPMVV